MVAGPILLSRWGPQYVDIMLEVLQCFDHRQWDCDRDGLEVERTSSLSRFAQTCKAFFGLAIPILWRRLRSLIPLFRLIGSFPNTKGQTEDMVSLGIYPYRWCRLCTYAAYVAELDALDAEFPLDPSIWRMMQNLTRGRPLLPNLRHLLWRITSSQCTALVHLVSPSLTRLVVHCFPPKGGLSPVEQLEWSFALWMPLSLTLPRAPRLTHVSLSYSCFHSPAVLSPISRLNSLQSFRWHVDCSTYGASIPAYDLFLFPNTERLEDLDVYCELAVSNDVCQRDVAGFRTLRSLSMSHGPGSDLCYSSFASSSLAHLTIHRYRDATLMDFRATCAIWSRQFSSLQSFSCEFASTLTAPLRLADAIAPLFLLHDMREFKLTFALNSQLTAFDEDLAGVAQSWPHLTSFVLIASSTSGEPSWDADGPGFWTLEAFRRHCPALVRLWLPHLALRLRGVPAVKLVPREGEHGMREFVARWIDADDYRLAAALVNRLFPYLDNRAALWGNSLGQDEGNRCDVDDDKM